MCYNLELNVGSNKLLQKKWNPDLVPTSMLGVTGSLEISTKIMILQTRSLLLPFLQH